MNAMILAAGLGTRLGEVGRTVPKVLLDIDGKTLLERHLDYLERQGVRRVVVNAHHLAARIQAFVERYEGPLEIVCIVEERLLGTAGGVRNALPHLEPGPFVVLYGDVLVEEPLEPILELHRERGAVATIGVYEADSAEGKGVVEVDETGRVTRFAEKESREPGPVLINSGLYVLEDDLVAPLAPGAFSDFGHDVFPSGVEHGLPIFTYRVVTPAIDIGTPEGLSIARSTVEAGQGAAGVDFSVVVCAHDEGRWQELRAAVGSLEEQVLRPREVVIVVDNNSDLLERARAELTAAVVVENTHVPGLGGARNSGIAASSGSVVAFLDDDAVASPEWLRLLAEHYAAPEVAGVGGGIEPVWEDARPTWFPPEFDWVVGCTYLGMPETTRDVRNLFGCNMSFRRELLEELGGFRLGYGCDETELCIRLRQRWPEKRLLYVPDAKVLHGVSGSRTRFRRFLSRCYFEGGSKAVVGRLVGTDDGLSSEYRYTRRVLPVGVRRGLADFLRHGDASGLARAAAIVAGFASTATGYAAGSLRTARAARVRGWSGPI